MVRVPLGVDRVSMEDADTGGILLMLLLGRHQVVERVKATWVHDFSFEEGARLDDPPPQEPCWDLEAKRLTFLFKGLSSHRRDQTLLYLAQP